MLFEQEFRRTEARHHAKFCRNWSIHRRDIAIFEFLKMAASDNLDCFAIVKFYWLTGSEGQRGTIMPNFVQIGQSVAKIL